MSKKDLKESVGTFVLRLIKKTLSNIKDIRGVISSKEKYILLISIIITLSSIFYYKLPKFTLVLVFQYFVWKSLFEIIRENIVAIKFKGISKLFDNRLKVVSYKDHKYVLHSFIPVGEIEKKESYIEHFLNKKIVSITRGKNFKVITIHTEDKRVKTKLKKLYKLSEYIKIVDTKGYTLPFLIGIDKKGDVIIGDMYTMKNILIAGLPGGGKSIMVNSFLQSLMYYNSNINFILVDFKIVELCIYENFDNVNFVETIDQLLKILEKVNTEMERRYKYMRGKYTHINQSPDNIPYIIIVIDEVSEIRLNCEKEISDLIEKLLIVIMNKGRAAGIYTIIATQRPNADQFNPNIKANANQIMSCKVGNKVTQNIIGVKGTENLKIGEFKTVSEGEEEGVIYKGFFCGQDKHNKDTKTFEELQKVKEKGGVNLEKN